MKNLYKILILALVIAVAVSLSGCCCCYGMDGFTSKYKKSVSNIEFPSVFEVGGKKLTKIKSVFYSTTNDCKNAVIDSLGEEGVDASDYTGMLDTALSASGAMEGKSFEYADSTGTKRIGGFVGRSDSPGKLAATYLAGSQVLPSYGGVSVTGSYSAGNEANRLETDLYHKYAYISVCRDSNMFIYAVSFDSATDAEAAVRMALESCSAAT
jgi:hypothetical protein